MGMIKNFLAVVACAVASMGTTMAYADSAVFMVWNKSGTPVGKIYVWPAELPYSGHGENLLRDTEMSIDLKIILTYTVPYSNLTRPCIVDAWAISQDEMRNWKKRINLCQELGWIITN